jgi:hypothetical protein
MMFKDNYHNHVSKFIATQKPNNKVKVDDVAAKANTRKLCECPGNEPGKVKIDVNQHMPTCRFRKRCSQYATKTLAVPDEIRDGCSLGIVLRGEENF